MKLEELQKEVEKIGARLKKMKDLLSSENLDKLKDVGQRLLVFFEKNHGVFQVGVNVAAIATSTLAYRMLLKSFSNATYPAHIKLTDKLVIGRTRGLTKFATIGALAIITLFMLLGQESNIFNYNFVNIGTDNTGTIGESSLLLFITNFIKNNKYINKIPKWILEIIISLILLLITKAFLITLAYMSPSLYEWLAQIDWWSTLKYPWLIWTFGFTLYHIISLVLFDLFSVNNFVIPKTWPKFIKNDLLFIQSTSDRSNLKEWSDFREVYKRQIYVYLFINIISICLIWIF